MEGTSSVYKRVGDAGGAATFHFCPDCGATVYFEIDKMPGFIAVPVGAFADATFPGPAVSIYEARKHTWVVLDGDITHME